jgi:hypothetical protein
MAPPLVTHISLSDGFGSQFQHIISVLLICYRNGYQFVYNPIKKIEHNYSNDPDFIEKMENLMNIKPYFKTRYDESLQNEAIIECDMTAKYVIDNDVNFYACPTILKNIQKMFWANKDRGNVFTNGDTNVAVHIRRMNQVDVTLPYVEPERVNTSDDFYLRAIQRVRDSYPEKDLVFHIYSQGNMESFNCYKAKDTILHIDEDISKTFVEMVAADILITSFSSFSYSAALLNDGTIFYHPFWHPPRSDWHILY